LFHELLAKIVDGTISVKELREAMKQAGHDATEEMVKNMLKSHDKDGMLAMHAYCAYVCLFVRLSFCLSTFLSVCLLLSETANAARGCAVPGENIPRGPYDVTFATIFCNIIHFITYYPVLTVVFISAGQ
jgi:hypothetical protein